MITPRTREEIVNSSTHIAGFCFAVFTSWYMIWLGCCINWCYTLGVSIFVAGMMLMYGCSTLYHWCVSKKAKLRLRKLDHISIYVMIAASYSPICIGLLGGVLGWTMFAVQWALVIGGIFYKVFAFGKLPALSLGIYLTMGWSIIFIAKPVYLAMGTLPMICILAEGLFYTFGTYFFTHDSRKYYHAVWHVFVLLGSIAHWLAVLFIMKGV
ncbi:MAG: hemolysin III family protein [Bacteroidaceae bacterium]|nr:hemolysin III family protein [Bacteroidaceae bacterium]